MAPRVEAHANSSRGGWRRDPAARPRGGVRGEAPPARGRGVPDSASRSRATRAAVRPCHHRGTHAGPRRTPARRADPGAGPHARACQAAVQHGRRPPARRGRAPREPQPRRLGWHAGGELPRQGVGCADARAAHGRGAPHRRATRKHGGTSVLIRRAPPAGRAGRVRRHRGCPSVRLQGAGGYREYRSVRLSRQTTRRLRRRRRLRAADRNRVCAHHILGDAQGSPAGVMSHADVEPEVLPAQLHGRASHRHARDGALLSATGDGEPRGLHERAPLDLRRGGHMGHAGCRAGRVGRHHGHLLGAVCQSAHAPLRQAELRCRGRVCPHGRPGGERSRLAEAPADGHNGHGRRSGRHRCLQPADGRQSDHVFHRLGLELLRGRPEDTVGDAEPAPIGVGRPVTPIRDRGRRNGGRADSGRELRERVVPAHRLGRHRDRGAAHRIRPHS